MKAKKNKDLESELINDLLNDEDSSGSTGASALPPSVTDATIKINSKNTESKGTESKKSLLDAVRSSVGSKFTVRPNASSKSMGSEAALVQSENLRVAQERMFELEHEIDRLRRENEQLAAAGETLRKRADELLADNEFKSKKIGDIKERLDSEKEILEASLKAKDREAKELRMKVEEFEMRLSSNLQKIRVRERELENRLELVKMESSAIVRSKDELILELKRQTDQLSSELDNYRNKGQDLNRQISEKQETLRRTVKALRLALTMLEGGSEDGELYKKAK
jgi:chromosome segregation ATPase